MRHWFEHNGERMCDGLLHARQCGITISRNVPPTGSGLLANHERGRAGLFTARQGIARSQCPERGCRSQDCPARQTAG